MQNGGSVSGYHELMTSLTAQRSPATVRRTGSRAVFLYIADRVENSLFCRMACVLHRRRGHCRRPGIMGVDEHFTGPPLPRHRYPSSRHTLPDLPPHGRLSPRQPQRGLNRALPPGPSPGACHPAPVTSRSRRTRQASPSPQLRSAKHERCKLCAGVRPGRLRIVLQPHRIYRLQSRCSRSCQRDSNPASVGRSQPGGSSRAQRFGMQTAARPLAAGP